MTSLLVTCTDGRYHTLISIARVAPSDFAQDRHLLDDEPLIDVIRRNSGRTPSRRPQPAHVSDDVHAAARTASMGGWAEDALVSPHRQPQRASAPVVAADRRRSPRTSDRGPRRSPCRASPSPPRRAELNSVRPADAGARAPLTSDHAPLNWFRLDLKHLDRILRGPPHRAAPAQMCRADWMYVPVAVDDYVSRTLKSCPQSRRRRRLAPAVGWFDRQRIAVVGSQTAVVTAVVDFA